MRTVMPRNNYVSVVYSLVNQAYFVLWLDRILSVHNDKFDAVEEYTRILTGISK